MVMAISLEAPFKREQRRSQVQDLRVTRQSPNDTEVTHATCGRKRLNSARIRVLIINPMISRFIESQKG